MMGRGKMRRKGFSDTPYVMSYMIHYTTYHVLTDYTHIFMAQFFFSFAPEQGPKKKGNRKLNKMQNEQNKL